MNDDELFERLGHALDPVVPPLDAGRVAAVRAAAAAGPVGSPVEPLRSRRSMLRLGAAAAAGIAVGGTGGVLLSNERSDAPALEAVAVRSASGVSASAGLIAHTWGLEVVLDITGLPAGTAYEMTFVTTDGRRVAAGGFIGTGGRMICRNNGAVLRSDVARVVVAGPDGAEAVAADLA
ncbi:MAG: anti-sigma factor [Acidimicrobiia bacterium]